MVAGLRNSRYAQLSRSTTGYFTFLDLPLGQQTLLFRKGIDQALTYSVDVELGSDGQPQGILLGDVALRYMVYVLGEMRVPSGYGLGAFSVVDSATGLHGAPANSGNPAIYEFPALPVGDHVLRFAMQATDYSTSSPVTLVGGPLAFTLSDADQRTSKTLGPTTLHPASATAPGQLTFRLRILGAPTVKLADIQITLTALTAGPRTAFSGPGPDSTGLFSNQVYEGLYKVVISVPDSTILIPPPDLDVVVLDGQETDMGDVYVVADATAIKAQSDCRTDADCGGGQCQDNLCAGLTSQDVTAFNLPPCDTSVSCVTGDLCTGGVTACALSASGSGYCLPLDTTCTPDGATLLCSPGPFP